MGGTEVGNAVVSTTGQVPREVVADVPGVVAVFEPLDIVVNFTVLIPIFSSFTGGGIFFTPSSWQGSGHSNGRIGVF